MVKHHYLNLGQKGGSEDLPCSGMLVIAANGKSRNRNETKRVQWTSMRNDHSANVREKEVCEGGLQL
jgi:hypothetical protein